MYVVDVDGSHDRPALPDDVRAIPTTVHIVWARDPAALPAPHRAANMVTVVPTRELRLQEAVRQLSVDRARAVTVTGSLRTWSASTGETSSRGIPCDTDVYDPAVGSGLDAAICFEELNTRGFDEATVAGPGGRGGPSVSVERWAIEGIGAAAHVVRDPQADLHVAGGGSLMVALAGTVLRGRRLVTLSGRLLTVRDLSGKRLLRRIIAAGSSLQDARGDLVVLERADRLHLLRLSDGHELTLRLPGISP